MIYYGLNLSTLADFALDVVVIFLLFCFVVITAPTTPAPVTTAAPGPMPDISKFLSCSSLQTDRQTDRQTGKQTDSLSLTTM